MRFVDLAVAALFGTSAFTGRVAWDPHGGDLASGRLALQTRLRDGLLTLVQERGIAGFLQSSPSTVCAYLAALSNSSSGVFATLGTRTCGAPPPRGSTTASLTLDLIPLAVTLVAWSRGQG